MCVGLVVLGFFFLQSENFFSIRENILIGKKLQLWFSMTAYLTFKLTFITRSCVLDCVKPLPEVGENHTVEKFKKIKQNKTLSQIYLWTAS